MYVYDLLTGRFRRRFSQSALLPRIELVHCVVVMHIHLFYMFVHTCFHHSFTHLHFIEYRMRASSSHIICSALCVCSLSLSLSLCCAADTNRDEGKRMKDASRESDIYISYNIVCVRWRYRLKGVKYVHANYARIQRPLFLSLVRAPVWKTGTRGGAMERAS